MIIFEVKNSPLSREDKTQVSNWYISMARILLNQYAVTVLKSGSSLEVNHIKIELCLELGGPLKLYFYFDFLSCSLYFVC